MGTTVTKAHTQQTTMFITCVQFRTIVLHIALALQSVTLSTHRSLGLHVKKVLVTQAHEFQLVIILNYI